VTISADGASTSAGRGIVSNNNGGDIYLGDVSSLPAGTTINVSNDAGPEQSSGGPTSGSESARSRDGNRAPAGDADSASQTRPTAGDEDGDNYPDALEADAGLDPTNPDIDADGVADGDEGNVYGTDPLLFDTDGDGYGDGEELFWTDSDPLDPNNRSGIKNTHSLANYRDPVALTAQQEIGGDQIAIGGMTSGPDDGATATGGQATTFGDGDASAAPGDIAHEGAQTSAAPTPIVCGDFSTWYDAQTAYEDEGGLDGPAQIADSIDRDHDGIACESMMENES
ncbi:MAG: hypothetical protein ACR2J8_09260, partial [Thermomicrobiales bacterium]